MAIATKKQTPPAELTDPLGPLPFERRSCTRHPAIGTLEAVQCDGFTRPVVVKLRLFDEGSGGLSAQSDKPMPPGSKLRVRTCPATGVWRDGVVLRCQPIGDGYRVALIYERLKAA